MKAIWPRVIMHPQDRHHQTDRRLDAATVGGDTYAYSVGVSAGVRWQWTTFCGPFRKYGQQHYPAPIPFANAARFR